MQYYKVFYTFTLSRVVLTDPRVPALKLLSPTKGSTEGEMEGNKRRKITSHPANFVVRIFTLR